MTYLSFQYVRKEMALWGNYGPLLFTQLAWRYCKPVAGDKLKWSLTYECPDKWQVQFLPLNFFYMVQGITYIRALDITNRSSGNHGSTQIQ